jgi:hypothetical protein
MEDCACVDFNNRCDEHKNLVIPPNLAEEIMYEYKRYNDEDAIGGEQSWESMGSPKFWENMETDGGNIPETDAMGREKFWEDMGRPNE